MWAGSSQKYEICDWGDVPGCDLWSDLPWGLREPGGVYYRGLSYWHFKLFECFTSWWNVRAICILCIILFTTGHVWERTHDLWHTSQSLYQHTHRGAKSNAIIGTSSFLPHYLLRLASTSTKQPTSYTHTWTDTLIMKYQRRNSTTRGLVLTQCIHQSLKWNFIHNWKRLATNPRPVTHQSVTLSTYPPRS